MTVLPPRGIPAGDVLVRVEDLTKTIGRRPVLSGVDLLVHGGEVAAVVGPHGSGKSTLLRVLVDLLRPSSGSVTLLGATSRRGARRRRSVGFLPAPVRFQPVGTVRSTLGYAARLSGAPVAPFRDLARRLGLDLRSRTAGLDVNGTQRLAIAVALGHRPRVALLDEPSTALDANDLSVLTDVLRELRDDGAAIVLASHRLDPFADLADHVTLLSQGTIALDGSASAMRRSLPTTAAVTFAASPPIADLATIDPGLEVNGHQVRLKVGPHPGRLLRLLAGHTIESIEMTTPSLSDALVEYYGEDDPLEGRSVIGDGP
ncbi:MAG TPA: ABC transporter ATP-binding protein [Propionibacteriaceae bacterium]|nr:ABC transporter ATP-binding protein [Propionibacteriaceae bacterium]HPZ50222.1 ABC transporter ATP-binding protein [Propionibacteriaceae bacterium]